MLFSNSLLEISTLLGKYYEFWSLRMKRFLEVEECWDSLLKGYVELTQEQLATMNNNKRNSTTKLRKKEHRAKCWIQNSIDDSIFSKITNTSTKKEVRDILKDAYHTVIESENNM